MMKKIFLLNMQNNNLKFKILIIFFIVTAGIFGLVKFSQAATYYIDYGQSGDNNVCSLASPCKHSPGDSNYTGTVTLTAGDTVYFKGGVTYTGRIGLNWSGSSDSSRIIYDGNTAGTWGTGRAVMDGGSSLSDAFVTSSARNYLTIQGFEIRYYTGTGVTFSDQSTISTGITINNNYIHDIGCSSNGCDCSGGGSPFGNGVYAVRLAYSAVSNNTILRPGYTGLELPAMTYSTISGNSIGHMVWGIDIPVNSAIQVAHDITVSGNTLFDTYYYDDGFMGAGCSPHTVGIFPRGTSDNVTKLYNVIIEGNLFYNNYSFTNSGGTAFIEPSYGRNYTIRNNVFINSHPYVVIQSYQVDGMYIYNNSFYGTGPIRLSHDESTGDKVVNNIFATGTNYLSMASEIDTGVLKEADYNLILPSTYVAIQDSPGWNPYTWSAWKGIGFDIDSPNQPANVAAIKFVSTTGYPTACETMDLRLQSDSPARDVGKDLSSTGFSTDKNGISRPQGSAWDIGAYEYVGVAPADTTPPAAPSGVVVL